MSDFKTLVIHHPRDLDDTARVQVKKDGVLVGARRAVNFITGKDISLAIADDVVNEETDTQIDVSLNGVVNDPALLTITKDVTIDGSLTVDGAAVYMYTETVVIDDNTLLLNANVTGAPTEDSGIQIERGTSTDASLIWDETNDCWKAGLVGSELGVVLGAASSVDSNIVEFNGTDGKVIKDSLLTHTNVASTISLKHTQGTDQALDTGGANEITATNAKAAYTHSSVVTGNPHSVTKTEVGLGNCDNTTDANKPVSTATQTALDLKVTGAASSVDNTIPRFDLTTGKLIQTSGVVVDDLDNMITGTIKSNQLFLPEVAIPSTPPTDVATIYVENLKGFPSLSFKDETGMVRKLLRDSVFVVKATVNITIGQSVYADGSSGNVPTVSPAKSDSITTMPAIGIAIEAITAGAFGRVIQVGLLENINTNAFNEGNVLYTSSTVAGELVVTAPLYPNIRQSMGTVLVKGVENGCIQVFARSLFNDGIIDHGGLLGLTDDDHTQYSLLAGRASGQTVYGGIAANEDLILEGTSHATKDTSSIILQPTSGNVGIGTTTPVGSIHDITSIGNPALFGGNTIGLFTACTFPTATKTKISKTGIGTGMAVGDLVIVTGGTGATVGSYRATVIDSADLITVDRNIHALGTDIVDGTVSTAKDVVGIFATDGVNDSRIASYSHQNKPLQIGGDTLRTTTNLTGKDIAIGSHLNLPQVNEPATPTLSFGDGDSGFYESVDDGLEIAIATYPTWSIGQTIIYGLSFSKTGALKNIGVSGTVPGLTFSNDTDTGLGSAGADQLSLIAGGVEAMRLTETAGVVQAIVPQINTSATPTIAFGDGDSGFYEEADDSIIFSLAGSARWKLTFDFLGSLSLSARLLAAAPSATVPSTIPVAGDVDTGLGSAGADQLSLIAGGVEAMRLTETAGAISHSLTGQVIISQGSGVMPPADSGVTLCIRDEMSGVGTALDDILTIAGSEGTGTLGVGGGVGIAFDLETNPGFLNTAGRIGTVLTNATHATRATDMVFQTVLAGSIAEKLRIVSDGKIQLQGYATASAPAYVEGAIYYDTTLHKLRIGGAAAWETITSA